MEAEEAIWRVVANLSAPHAIVINAPLTFNMNKLGQAQDFESYEIEEPSDEERAASRCEDNTGVYL